MGSCLSGESGNNLPVSPHLSSPGSRRRRRSSKKRSRSQSSSFSFQKDELLHRIPGRMFLNGSSEVASLFSQQGKKGVNQDAMIVWENFGSRKDTVFCGVFDGHGPYGHLVSKRVRDLLPLKLSSHMEGYVSHEDVLREINPNTADKMNSENTAFISANEDSRASIVLKNEENYPDIFQTLKGSFLKAFKLMDKDLKMQGNIDCLCSGTTAVTLIKQGRHLVIGNVGDSRAVLATRSEDNILSAVQLTVDLKPNVPAEAERILKRKGRVFALQDEPEVARVWLPHLDAPGLAMARAFGDFCLKDFGLISVPELSYRCLTEKDEFIVLATDGIWDVLSNEEVVEIIASTPRRASAARALVDSAVRGWRRKFPTSKVDDCAVVCLFLDSKSDHLSTASNTKPKGQKDNMMAEQGDARMSKAIMLEESETDILLPSEMGGRWCALEGVARVNTLVNLPRFPPVKEEKASRGKGACK